MIEIADFEIMGIFDITVNGVLVHSRKCDTHVYGVHRQQWLRDSWERKNAVWYAIDSIYSSSRKAGPKAGNACSDRELLDTSRIRCTDDGNIDREPAIVTVQHSHWYGHQAKRSAQSLRGWFPSHSVEVLECVDTNSEDHFSIAVNGVLLHSRQFLGHDFFSDEWEQQDLVWKAVKGLLESDCH